MVLIPASNNNIESIIDVGHKLCRKYNIRKLSSLKLFLILTQNSWIYPNMNLVVRGWTSNKNLLAHLESDNFCLVIVFDKLILISTNQRPFFITLRNKTVIPMNCGANLTSLVLCGFLNFFRFAWQSTARPYSFQLYPPILWNCQIKYGKYLGNMNYKSSVYICGGIRQIKRLTQNLDLLSE